MYSSEELKKMTERNTDGYNRADNQIKKEFDELDRVSDILADTPQILDDLDEEFEFRTGLRKNDVIILFIATALQCIRQYFLSNEKFRFRTAAQGDDFMKNTVGVALPKTVSDVLFSSVPYDAFARSGDLVDYETELSGKTHRYRTLGHDPLLGLVFGPVNILSSSCTKYDFVTTYSVADNKLCSLYPGGTPGAVAVAIEQSKNSKLLLAAVARQFIHMGSDFFTKQGLPIPIISSVNNDAAMDMLTKYHIDIYSVSRGAAVAAFINSLVECIHRLFYNPDVDGEAELYAVRGRKVVSYSNLIATASNVIYVALSAYFGNEKSLEKLDVGGMIVTVYRLITDKKFIRAVKEEFIFGSYRNMIMG